MSDLDTYARSLGQNARTAASALTATTGAVRQKAIGAIADALHDLRQTILDANAADIAAAHDAKLAAPLIKRLELNDKKIESMAQAVEQIAAQVDPIGQTIEAYNRPNGLRIEKRRVPIGVVLFFYESRPNVTSDAAALCLKSGNAVILRGGKEAIHSNRAIGQAVVAGIESAGLPRDTVQVVENTDRAMVSKLLKLDKFIDLVIPRGGESLIRAVVAESTIPVLKHFTGNCHVYVDGSAVSMEAMVRSICVNAKTSYPGGAVCNAVEHILFHKDAAGMISKVCQDLIDKGVEIRGDERTRKYVSAAKPATEEDWDTEYLDFIVGIKVVDSIDQAIDHINRHGSHHTDAIISGDLRSIDRFIAQVDSASVMVNASTRFADGGEYGLGAEIGISTDKLHARGPMGAADLTTYKWIVTGDGHIRT